MENKLCGRKIQFGDVEQIKEVKFLEKKSKYLDLDPKKAEIIEVEYYMFECPHCEVCYDEHFESEKEAFYNSFEHFSGYIICRECHKPVKNSLY